MLPLKFISLFVFICLNFKNVFSNNDIEDRTRTVPEVISSRGFIPQVHEVTTADGYILTVHRIINPLLVNNGLKKKPVILQHGLLCSSSDWVVNNAGGDLRALFSSDN